MGGPAATISSHAVILAAGTGSRMPPLVTDENPKALLTVGNRPLVFYSLHALLLSEIPSATIVIPPTHNHGIIDYCENQFYSDPLIQKLNRTINLSFHIRPPDAGTADVLRDLAVLQQTLILLSVDTVTDVSVGEMLSHHLTSAATATVALARISAPAVQKISGKQAKKSKDKQSSKPSSAFTIDHYALLTPQNRLLSLTHPTDITSGRYPISSSITKRYRALSLHTNLFDPHIYILHFPTVSHILSEYPAISSLRFDLIPYLARRQHTLSRRAQERAWPFVADDITVVAYITNLYSRRANTIADYMALNSDVINSKVSTLIHETPDPKQKKKKPSKPSFANTANRTSVSESLIDPDVTAGDNTSVKKSVIGLKSVLGTGVKINGCVLMPHVTIADRVNMSGCVVCAGASVGVGTVLKECRVAPGVHVSEGIEDSARDFTAAEENFGLGEDIEFC